ncbi:MAG: hypothetical protein JSU85_09835 [Candidatus Zixiibacteriota bacterium]|nr:MAG: hypothetical protein JSU85_09835 [candidate division Zixibacteria bacterium]
MPDYGNTKRDRVFSLGGARVGGVNATFPLASLTARKDKLDLSVAFIGNYTFTANQVVSVEKYVTIPLLGWGIRINHNVSTYPEKMVYWCLGSPGRLINKIKETGFLPGAGPHSVPVHTGFPVRPQAIITLVVIWNLLLMMDFGFPPRPFARPGWYTFSAVFLLFIMSIAVRRAEWLQRWVLKPERSLGEIKPWLNLLAIVCGMLSIFIFIALITGFLR